MSWYEAGFLLFLAAGLWGIYRGPHLLRLLREVHRHRRVHPHRQARAGSGRKREQIFLTNQAKRI